MTVSFFPFDNSYARMPDGFHVRLDPVPVAEPRLVALNRGLAQELGLDPDALAGKEGLDVLAGNRTPEGAEPLAMAYAGHQFGHFVPQLGDGRAILLGEIVDREGRRRDIQLKGSGRTPFSRSGDGRAALGPVLREYVVSEAMHALGIPTTRSLAAVTTGETVFRETALPGAVLTRVASSHIRVGTFQYFAARGDEAAVRRLADHVIDRHYPGARQAAAPYAALLEAISERQAALVANWIRVGFIHGVMNTDNMAVSGETIDYGPCAFMDAYDPQAVFSSIDHAGRYAFSNQPLAAQWNLARLAETLLQLIDSDADRAVARANGIIGDFTRRFEQHRMAAMRRKLGLTTEQEGDEALVDDLLGLMHAAGADYTLAFRRLSDGRFGAEDSAVHQLFPDPEPFGRWIAAWTGRLAREPMDPVERAMFMRQANPAVIPRNHRVEQAIAAAVGEGDFAPTERLVEALAHPHEDRQEAAYLMEPPAPGERVLRTFCGT